MTVRVLVGDCRDMLATLPDASVQCCVTSPPYYGLRDYGVAGQIGLEQTPDAYVAEMVAVFREVRRVLRDDGTLWLNIGDSYNAAAAGNKTPSGFSQTRPSRISGNGDQETVKTGRQLVAGLKPKDLLGIPWAVAFALRADGWWLRSDIIWAKPNPMPESVTDRPTSAHEHVFLLSKRERYSYDADAVAEPAERAGEWNNANPQNPAYSMSRCVQVGTTRNLRNVWTIATQPFAGSHFATMPPDLAERCIKAGTSERGQCGNCGKPWERVVERTGADMAARYARGEPGRHGAAGAAASGASNVGGYSGASVTTGWSPTCACPEHTPVPQTVLDPFFGAGTTGLVADRLGRNCIGIELNPQYADLARERLRGDCPMFAEVA